ncbi:hypothetical protein RRG08_042937 [Elysia crispata]|uniref:Uncharacterized protein n=1 Tax=Elysia crispata TaxID=231223 RepID=A0AAE1AUE2_9GAST|nr:hypothetical protein RRG08_042937 [Elysia crispata]
MVPRNELQQIKSIFLEPPYRLALPGPLPMLIAQYWSGGHLIHLLLQYTSVSASVLRAADSGPVFLFEFYITAIATAFTA